MDFINRSKGTELENEYSILLNLLLVKEKVRLCTLIEVYDYENPRECYEDFYKLVKKIYPEFIYKLESINSYNDDKRFGRFFASMDTLPDFDKEKYNNNYNIYLGKLLGYNYPGIVNYENNFSNFGLDYYTYFNNKKVILYSQIQPCQNIIDNKLGLYNAIFQHHKLGEVFKDLTEIVPLRKYIQIIKDKGEYRGNKNYFIENQESFKNKVWGYGWGLFSEMKINNEIFNDNSSNKKLLNWIIYVILLCVNDPFSVIYPIHIIESEIMEKEQNRFFKENFECEPYIMLDKLKEIYFVKNIFDTQPNLIHSFNKIREKTYSEYLQYKV